MGARGGIPFEGTIGYLENSKKEVKTWRPGGFVIRLQKMYQPIWDLRIWNPQQARMLLLVWGLQSPRLPLRKDGIFTFLSF